MVELHLAKVDVAGSSPVSRSKAYLISVKEVRWAFLLFISLLQLRDGQTSGQTHGATIDTISLVCICSYLLSW